MTHNMTLAELLRMQYEHMNKLERLEFEKLLAARLPGVVIKAASDARKNKNNGDNYDNKKL
jgi:hypothetical protein